jgi:hypothetical protein
VTAHVASFLDIRTHGRLAAVCRGTRRVCATDASKCPVVDLSIFQSRDPFNKNLTAAFQDGVHRHMTVKTHTVHLVNHYVVPNTRLLDNHLQVTHFSSINGRANLFKYWLKRCRRTLQGVDIAGPWIDWNESKKVLDLVASIPIHTLGWRIPFDAGSLHRDAIKALSNITTFHFADAWQGFVRLQAVDFPPSLTSLSISSMSKLERFDDLPPQLLHLSIRNCPKFRLGLEKGDSEMMLSFPPWTVALERLDVDETAFHPCTTWAFGEFLEDMTLRANRRLRRLRVYTLDPRTVAATWMGNLDAEVAIHTHHPPRVEAEYFEIDIPRIPTSTTTNNRPIRFLSLFAPS